MIADGLASDESDAVQLGNLLLQAGVFRHVLNEHHFKNEQLFYRFSADADHGKIARNAHGHSVSWGDLIAPVTAGGGDANLQAHLPERDPALATFTQDELDRIDVSPLDEHNVKLLDNTRPRRWIDPTPKARYNLVVIGAGSGGLVSAAGQPG